MIRAQATVIALALSAVAIVSAQAPVAPRGVSAALSTIEDLRKENGRLQAMLIGRDRALANCHYDLQKRAVEFQRRIMEVQADLDQTRLSARAEALLPTLRQLYEVSAETPFDWDRGIFKETGESRQEQKETGR